MIPYTKLKEHDRHNLRDVIPLKKPFTLIIEPTSLCNFRCIQCFQSIRGQTPFTGLRQHMDMECFHKVIDELKRWEGPKIKVLKLSLYGEPFLNPLFCEMLRAASEAQIAARIETTTNASLLTETVSRKLVEQGLDYMRVSIYSAVQARHSQLTGSKISIATIHSNLATLQAVKRALKSQRPFISVKWLDTYGPENDLLREKYQDVADEIYMDKPHNWVGTPDQDFMERLYGKTVGKAKEDVSIHNSTRTACTLPFFTLAVRSNGDVSPCCNDWIGGTTLGSVHAGSLRSVWEGPRMFEFRKMQLENRKEQNSSCRHCRFYLNDYYIRDNIDGFPVEKLLPGPRTLSVETDDHQGQSRTRTDQGHGPDE